MFISFPGAGRYRHAGLNKKGPRAGAAKRLPRSLFLASSFAVLNVYIIYSRGMFRSLSPQYASEYSGRPSSSSDPPSSLNKARPPPPDGGPTYEYPFSGTYSCPEPGSAYAASWLVHRTKFLATVRFGSWWTESFDPSDDMKRPGWEVGTNVTFKPTLNMEGASDIVLGSEAGSDPRKTKDLFDFAVEHLSEYEHVLGLKEALNSSQKAQGRYMLRGWTDALKRRVEHLARGWELGIDAGGGNSSARAALGDRVLAVVPFYLNVDGGGGYQSGSVHHTRTLYLNATYLSVSRLFPNVVAFLANGADLRYCLP